MGGGAMSKRLEKRMINLLEEIAENLIEKSFFNVLKRLA